jgi:hypothetical protein
VAQLLRVAFTPDTLQTGESIRVWVSRPVSAGVSRVPDLVLLLTATQLFPFALSPRTLTPTYTAKFGKLIAGQKIFVAVDVVSTKGIVSSRQLSSITVT